MIEYTTGDLLKDDAEALVNTVNCVGVMGRGIALQFKKAWPENFKAYEAACKREEVQPGRMFVFETGQLTLPRYIINFPTKRHWRGASRIADIEAGLVALVDTIKSMGIRTIAIPPRFERVAELVEGFESPFGMELLSTVHWILKHQPSATCVDDVVERAYAWSPGKRQFTPRQIGIAVNVLRSHGWTEIGERDSRA